MKSLTATRALVRQAERQAVRRAEVARQAVDLRQTYDIGNAELPLYNFADFASNGYASNAVVFTALDRRLSLFTEARFKFRNIAEKRLFGDPALAKLETPWPDGTTGDLLGRLEQDAFLAGNAYIRDTGDYLERLRPDWTTIVSALVRDPFGYQVRRVLGVAYDPIGDPDRDTEFYPIEQVAHYAPVPDPLANFRGMSPLTAVVREVNSDVRMAEYREAYFRNAASPNVVIKYSQKLAPERVERLQTRMRERHTGPNGVFGTLILDEGADLTVIGKDMVGSAFDALQAAGETRILMAAGVPAIVAGAREGLQASQIGDYAEAVRQLVDMKTRPNWRAACAALQKLVVVPPGAELWFDASDVSALQQGEKDRADTSAAQAETITKLVMQGFDPDSVVAAVVAGDMTLLKHTGALSVQVQPGPAPTAPPAPLNGKQPVPVGG